MEEAILEKNLKNVERLEFKKLSMTPSLDSRASIDVYQVFKAIDDKFENMLSGIELEEKGFTLDNFMIYTRNLADMSQALNLLPYLPINIQNKVAESDGYMQKLIEELQAHMELEELEPKRDLLYIKQLSRVLRQIHEFVIGTLREVSPECYMALKAINDVYITNTSAFFMKLEKTLDNMTTANRQIVETPNVNCKCQDIYDKIYEEQVPQSESNQSPEPYSNMSINEESVKQISEERRDKPEPKEVNELPLKPKKTKIVKKYSPDPSRKADMKKGRKPQMDNIDVSQDSPKSRPKHQGANTPTKNQTILPNKKMNTAKNPMQRSYDKMTTARSVSPMDRKIAMDGFLPFKELKELIEDIEASKRQYDMICSKKQLSFDTLKNYTNIYVKDKYINPKAIADFMEKFNRSLGYYYKFEASVQIFRSIFENVIDDGFFSIAKNIRDSLNSLLEVSQ